MADSDAYKSIFLEDDAPHQRYYGWRIAMDRRGLRLLQQKYGPFTRSLVLLTAEGRTAFDPLMVGLRRGRSLAEISVHDFDGVLDSPHHIAGMDFRILDDQGRLLNGATYVVDLHQSEESLFSALHSQFRRRVRQAKEQEFEMVVHEQPRPELFAHYYAEQISLSKQQGFSVMNRATLERMFLASNAVLFELKKNGAPVSYLLAYIAGSIGLFLYGVSLRKENDGAGQLLQWEVILGLKRLGCRWYDMGGVPTDEEDNGISEFKRKFGGAYVSLGQELRYDGPLLKAALQWRSRLSL